MGGFGKLEIIERWTNIFIFCFFTGFRKSYFFHDETVTSYVSASV